MGIVATKGSRGAARRGGNRAPVYLWHQVERFVHRRFGFPRAVEIGKDVREHEVGHVIFRLVLDGLPAYRFRRREIAAGPERFGCVGIFTQSSHDGAEVDVEVCLFRRQIASLADQVQRFS